MREAIGYLLKNELDMELVCEADDGHTAEQLARELQPDVIIMDVGMPKLNGIEAMCQSNAHSKSCPWPYKMLFQTGFTSAHK